MTKLNGWKMGCAVFLVCATTAIPSPAQTFTLLYTFSGGADGGSPGAGVIRDGAGNLYGTTISGGDPVLGDGVVFSLDSAGKETVLHTFTGGPDGSTSFASLLRDRDDNLYGTTSGGGTVGAGTVFKINKQGEKTVLHNFTGARSDGSFPVAGLVGDEMSNLYGTTEFGGHLYGAVFKLDKNGTEKAYDFKGKTDGAYPSAGLVRDGAGNFYGTTAGGFSTNSGTVFKINPEGEETVLYRFTGGADGGNPAADLLRDANGDLYGTAQYGGDLNCYTPYGCGVVFKVNAKGKETMLYSFTGNNVDGELPLAGLVRGADGNLYGTTFIGGTGPCYDGTNYGCGTVYMLDKQGTETVVYSFTGGADGASPMGDLVRDAAGDLYGVTNDGALGSGTVYKLTP